jgi:hypothetical protein
MATRIKIKSVRLCAFIQPARRHYARSSDNQAATPNAVATADTILEGCPSA